MLTYKIDQFVKKIHAPITCRYEGQEWKFENGEELADHAFDKRYLIDSLEIDESRAVLQLSEATQQAMNWTGEGAYLLDMA